MPEYPVSLSASAALGGDVAGKLTAAQVTGLYGKGNPGQPAAYANNSGQGTSRTLAATTTPAQDTTAATNVTPYGFAQAQANAVTANINKLITDVDNLQKTVGQIIADLHTLGATA